MLTDNLFVALAALLTGAPSAPGRYFIAVGAGDEAWDQAAPGEARATERLAEEVARKPVPAEQIAFLNEAGQPTEAPTPHVQFAATFEAGEGTGLLRECGLFGGAATEASGSGVLLSYHTHPRIDKAEGATLARTLRIDLTPRAIVPGCRVTRYLGNTATTELHDLDRVTTNCQIDEIRFDRRYYFSSVEAAAEANYDVCAYCFGRELSQR